MTGNDISDAHHKVACGTKTLMTMHEIVSDKMFIAALHKAGLFSHFAFLQKRDEAVGNIARYQCHHMTIRYYIVGMENDGWK